MVIGIFSDTHNRTPAINAAFEVFAKSSAELIAHCGDWMSPETVDYIHDFSKKYAIPLRGVLGNNDTQVQEMLRSDDPNFIIQEGVMRFDYDGQTFAIYHGHHKPTLRACRNDTTIDILLLGHSHKPLIESMDDKIIINPGSTAFSIPRSKIWRPTIALYDTLTRNAAIKYVD